MFLLLALIVSACNGSDPNPKLDIPDVPINRTINLDNPQYYQLQQPNGFIYLDDEGAKGVVVVNDNSGSYVALERNCTYDSRNTCAKVTMDKSGLYLLCGHYDDVGNFVECCSSKFAQDGGVINDPAIYGLIRYRTALNGSILTISN
ncbi:MAG: hypothetical protein M3Q97_07655 [Bacteroidota bacterium]|nr:hypothetical protein [Bacteroidota bacterium]